MFYSISLNFLFPISSLIVFFIQKISCFSLFCKNKGKVEEILIFSKQYSTMVEAGLPILEVLGMLRDQLEGEAIKEMIEDIRKSLEGGVTLSKCFEKYPEYFDNVYCNLIKAGEASGKLLSLIHI